MQRGYRGESSTKNRYHGSATGYNGVRESRDRDGRAKSTEPILIGKTEWLRFVDVAVCIIFVRLRERESIPNLIGEFSFPA